MKKIAYIDLETSGLDCEKDEIIKFSALVVGDDKKTIVFDKLAKPYKPLSPAVEKLTGISQSDLNRCEPSNIVKTEFISLIDDATVVGCNLDFDEKFLRITFSEKIELSQIGKKSIEKDISELQRLIKLGNISTVDVQRALHCAYPAARSIIDAFAYSPRNRKYDDNFFKLSEDERAECLESLINDKVCDFGYDTDIIYPRLRFEFVRIRELNLVTAFFVAKTVANTLTKINEMPHFIGMGCCSVIAYILGITGKKLDPIEHGLIFERGFPKDGNTVENLFGFYIEKTDCGKLVDELKKRFGENVTLTENENEFVLSVNGIAFRIITELDVLQEQHLQIDEMIDTSSIAVFQEDYMRLLHFVVGYSFDEANDVRKSICSLNKKAISKQKKNFVTSTGAFLPFVESEHIFDDIVKGLRHACCKAWVLSAKVILDAIFPF